MIKWAVFHLSINIGDIDTSNADGENDEAPHEPDGHDD